MALGNEGVPFTMPVEPVGTNSNNNGGWGGDWSAWIIIFVLFFAFGGWGNGFGGGWGGNGAGIQGALTRADLCSEFNFNGLENAVRGVQQGICDSTFALNNTVVNGFNGVQRDMCTGFANISAGISENRFATQQGFNATQVAMMQNQNALQAQISDCCCGVQRAIDGVNYNMATNTCALQNTMNNNTRDIIDNANANSRAILDYLCQDKISTLQNENQALRLAASQSAQNATLIAAMDANKADILRRTGAECPTPAYVVQPPTPVNFPTNCCGQFNGWNSGGCNGGCGC